MQQHLLHQKPKPGANNQLNDNSLIKWDNKNNETIINKARKLIWVAFNSKEGVAVKKQHCWLLSMNITRLYNLLNRNFTLFPIDTLILKSLKKKLTR